MGNRNGIQSVKTTTLLLHPLNGFFQDNLGNLAPER